MEKKGKLYFRYGTMGSAKTAMLLTTAYNFEERNMDYLCMKPVIDTRESKSVIRSRIGIELEPDAIHIMKKSEYSGLYGDYSLDIDPEAVPAESERAE